MLVIKISRICITLSLLFFSCIKENNQKINAEETELINNFLKALIDNSISSKKVAKDFLYIEHNSESLVKTKIEDLSKLIDIARNDNKKTKNDWKLMNPKVFELNQNHKEIHNYSEYKNLDKVNLNVSETEINNTFVLLNPDKTEILQYFWIKNRKIYSFNLFIQANEAWFFTYN